MHSNRRQGASVCARINRRENLRHRKTKTVHQNVCCLNLDTHLRSPLAVWRRHSLNTVSRSRIRCIPCHLNSLGIDDGGLRIASWFLQHCLPHWALNLLTVHFEVDVLEGALTV